MSKKKRAACVHVDSERILSELQSADENVRAKAVRSLCPCHAGWEFFEQHVGVVLRMEKDRSRAVRANALHVFEDAVRMQKAGNLGFVIQLVEEMTRKKRASRFRPEEAELEAKRRARKRRGRSGIILR